MPWIDYTDKQKKLIELLQQPEYAKNPREAMRLAGYSDKSPINVIIRGIKQELLEIAESNLSLHVLGCVDAIIDVRDNPDQKGAKAKLEASSTVLDRAGVIKKDKLEIEHRAASGVLIIPAKKDV